MYSHVLFIKMLTSSRHEMYMTKIGCFALLFSVKWNTFLRWCVMSHLYYYTYHTFSTLGVPLARLLEVGKVLIHGPAPGQSALYLPGSRSRNGD